MPEYKGRYIGSRDRYANDYGGASQLPQKSSGFNDMDEARFQVDSRDFERGSSKSRKRERKKERDWNSDIYCEGERNNGKDGDCKRDRDWDWDHDRHHRDHKNRERSERRHRHRNRGDDDYECRNDRDHGRHRDYDRDRETRSHHGSRSRSRSRSRNKRISGFDMVPPVQPAQTAIVPGVPAPVQTMTQQATRHARRVYVGGLSPAATEKSIEAFFNQVMSAIGGNTAGPGDAVVNVYINHEKKFAFVEMRTVAEASNAMALDGITFDGALVKVRRPSDYNSSVVAALGPTQPNPNLNLAAVGLTHEDPADRIFVGGLPYYLAEVQIRELLESFGPLRVFDLVKDQGTGNSKGYAFCIYQDLSVTDIVCAALNGIKMGEKMLTVRRANQGAAQPRAEQLESILLQAQKQLLHLPTKVVCLTQAVGVEELKNDEEYADILEDMREEGGRLGELVNVVIPRPDSNGELAAGVGKVFLVYADADGSTKARVGLNGRKFGGNQVVAVHYSEDKFAKGEYDG